MKKHVRLLGILLVFMLITASLFGCNEKKESEVIVGAEAFTYQQNSVVDISANNSYTEFFTGKGAFVVPGLLDSFVPQAIEYYKEKNWFLVCGYFSDGKPSCMFAIDKTTGKTIREVLLQKPDGTNYEGHAGGIATDGKNIYVSDDEQLLVMSTARVVDAEPSSTQKFDTVIDVPVNASYCNYSQGMLWVGEFEYSKEKYYTDDSHKNGEFAAWTIGYEIKSDGSLSPKIVLGTPPKTQGFTATENGYIISISYGRKNTSYIRSFGKGEASGTVMVNGVETPYALLDMQTNEIVCPPMTEGITCADGKLYAVFESATNKYYMEAPVYFRAKCPIDMVWELSL